MAPIRNRRIGTRQPALSIRPAKRTHASLFPLDCPFADNEADQIRTYITRDTYRQGVLSPSI